MKNHKNLAFWFVMTQSFFFCGLCCHHTLVGVGMGAGAAAVLPLFWRTGRPLPIAKWGEMLKYVLIGVGMGSGCYSCGFALFSRLSRALPIASLALWTSEDKWWRMFWSGHGGVGLALLSCSRSASRTCTLCSLLGDMLLSFMFQLRNIGLPEFFKVVMCLHVYICVCVKLHQSLYFQIQA